MKPIDRMPSGELRDLDQQLEVQAPAYEPKVSFADIEKEFDPSAPTLSWFQIGEPREDARVQCGSLRPDSEDENQIRVARDVELHELDDPMAGQYEERVQLAFSRLSSTGDHGSHPQPVIDSGFSHHDILIGDIKLGVS